MVKEGVRSKNGRGHKIYLTKLPTFDTVPQNTQQVYSIHSIFHTRYIFFYISMFVVSVINRYESIDFLCDVFIFWISNSSKALGIEFLFFLHLNTEKVSLLLMCSVKKGVPENGYL